MINRHLRRRQHDCPARGCHRNLCNPAGAYRLYAYIPLHGPLNGQRKRDAPHARYRWGDSTGSWQELASIDQEYYADQYVYLDRAVLPANARVLLGDDVGVNVDGERWVVFSDVAAVPD